MDTAIRYYAVKFEGHAVSQDFQSTCHLCADRLTNCMGRDNLAGLYQLRIPPRAGEARPEILSAEVRFGQRTGVSADEVSTDYGTQDIEVLEISGTSHSPALWAHAGLAPILGRGRPWVTWNRGSPLCLRRAELFVFCAPKHHDRVGHKKNFA